MKTWERMRCIVKGQIASQGIKQKFLANKCGFDEKTFSLMINGKKQITDKDLEQFCFGMDVLPSDVLKPRPKLQCTGVESIESHHPTPQQSTA